MDEVKSNENKNRWLNELAYPNYCYPSICYNPHRRTHVNVHHAKYTCQYIETVPLIRCIFNSNQSTERRKNGHFNRAARVPHNCEKHEVRNGGAVSDAFQWNFFDRFIIDGAHNCCRSSRAIYDKMITFRSSTRHPIFSCGFNYSNAVILCGIAQTKYW